MIKIRGLSKAFGNRWALREVDLDVAQGQFLTIFGPNGAGKTTLIRILATLSRPTTGTITLAGLELRNASAEVRRRIGLVSHQTLLYPDLTAEENLRFYGQMYDVPQLGERVQEVIELVDLAPRRHDPLRTYSRGMQQRLAIARAFIHDPPILLLDEPYTGLDPQATETLREALQRLISREHTIIMTTHNPERGLDLCDRVAILSAGRLAYQGAREELNVGDFQATYRNHVAAN
jgi:heme exporter protein A